MSHPTAIIYIPHGGGLLPCWVTAIIYIPHGGGLLPCWVLLPGNRNNAKCAVSARFVLLRDLSIRELQKKSSG